MKSLLQPEIQAFIQTHIKGAINELALKKNPFPSLDYKLILNQIEAKNKAENKLPTWFKSENILYPSKVSIEQTSSEVTAAFKSNFISGETLVDLTGGFGVDSFYFSKKIATVFHCEHQAELSEIVQHNFSQLGVNNINCVNGDGLDWLQKNNKTVDWIYIDPSRRHEVKGKVFLLADCEPNVPELVTDYWKFTNQILIKVAPILDITSAIRELEFVKDVRVVAYLNEVKELLFFLEKDWTGPITIHADSIAKDQQVDTFSAIFGENVAMDCELPQTYLYEPNAAVLKSGGQNGLAKLHQLKKLHPHTHLFTSTDLIDFPGRRFQITRMEEYSKAILKSMSGKKFNVATRNFPETVEEIRKKGKIKDGGEDYVFFVTLLNQKKAVLFTQKI